jgi:hypothetical protein
MTSVNNTGHKFMAGVVDTGHKIMAGVVDTGCSDHVDPFYIPSLSPASQEGSTYAYQHT